MISKQRLWQLKQIASGNCGQCGKKRSAYAAHCDICALKDRERMRRKKGSIPWSIGGRGRPPKIP